MNYEFLHCKPQVTPRLVPCTSFFLRHSFVLCKLSRSILVEFAVLCKPASVIATWHSSRVMLTARDGCVPPFCVMSTAKLRYTSHLLGCYVNQRIRKPLCFRLSSRQHSTAIILCKPPLGRRSSVDNNIM